MVLLLVVLLLVVLLLFALLLGVFLLFALLLGVFLLFALLLGVFLLFALLLGVFLLGALLLGTLLLSTLLLGSFGGTKCHDVRYCQGNGHHAEFGERRSPGHIFLVTVLMRHFTNSSGLATLFLVTLPHLFELERALDRMIC